MRSFWYLTLMMFGVCVVVPAREVQAQIRVVTYNTATSGQNDAPNMPRAGMGNILQAIGNESNAGIAKPIDVLLLQEQESSATTTQAIVNLLNGIYGAGTYARATLDGNTNGAGRPGMIYNTQSVSLQDQTAFGSTTISTGARQTLRYQLRPVGYASDADFYVYSSHLKASSGDTNETRREIEAQGIRNNGDALGQGAHLIYAGDYNVSGSSEPAYQEMLSAGNGQALDPINRPGSWHNSSTFEDIHTQSPYDTSFNDPTLIFGGVDDRYDFQLVTGEFLDNEGLSYISGTYHAFGNNGTHGLNNAINSNSNTAQPMSVLDDLASVSDHLPVVADYQLPSRMQVTVGSYPNRVIVGAAAQVNVDVWNSASVVAANGADELDYNLSGSGDVIGSTSGMDAALGSVNTHTLNLNTALIGSRSGQVNATSSSQQVANGSFSESVAYTVVDHANASFDSASDVNSLSLDFGILIPDGNTQTQGIDIHNLFSVAGATANLDLDAVNGIGDTSVLGIDLTTFQNLVAGNSISFNAELNSSGSGAYTSTWTLDFSDEDILGEDVAVDSLVLELTGKVTLPGDANLDFTVDLLDFNIWEANQFGPGTWSEGDFNFDGIVNFLDFNIWEANRSSSLPIQRVPEPSTPGLLVVLLLLGCRHPRRARG